MVQRIIDAYEAKFGHPPENSFAPLGYDAIGLIANAIEQAGSDDPAAVRDALAQTRDYPAVTGTVVQQEGAAADAGGLRLHQPQHELHRDGRIHGAATGLQHLHPRLDGQRIGGCHHGFGRGLGRLAPYLGKR